jgi:hypothetical protein
MVKKGAMINKCGWLIEVQPIDDFQEGPRVLVFKKEYYFSLFFRVRPLYIRFKWWPTRRSLVKDLQDAYCDPGVWTPSTFEYGELHSDAGTL